MSTSSGSSGDRNPVEALAEEFLDRQRRGERPTLEDYCRLHPELAEEIRDLFPVLAQIEGLRSDGPGDSSGEGDAPVSARVSRLGDFRILREVGRGGMGVVYEAEQESLGRRVALKVLPDSALSDALQVLRFQREAKAAARLHHTNIVPVFGVGQEGGRHYYVMQFIPGMGLDLVLQELRRLRRGGPAPGGLPDPSRFGAASVAEAILTGRFSIQEARDGVPRPASTITLDRPASGPLGPSPSSVNLPGASADSLAGADPDRTFFRSVARIGQQVAEALEYANRQGILHRDVKPSNLLLDPRGNVWVADFGLAKASDSADLTHSGDILGTVRYMAPERFAGKCDARSDVYALGLTLYEFLALRPAFEASDRQALMRRVMSEEPEPLDKLVPHLPRDLATIVRKAMAREPVERYPTAAALAEDLQRFLDDRPIRARRITAAEQAWRWARRNPAVAALAAGLLAALAAGLIGVTLAWRQAAANLELARKANRKAEARSALAMEAIRSFTSGASEDVLLREKGLSRLRNKLLEGSLTFYDRLAELLKDETDRTTRRSLVQAVYAAAELNGRIGSRGKALEVHRRALGLREALANEAPGDVDSRREVGQSELAIGETLAAMGRQAEARQAFARSRAVAEAAADERPDDAEARTLLADGLLAEGMSLFEELRLEDARPFLERSREIYDKLVRSTGSADATGRYLRGEARCAFQLGRWGLWYGRWAGTLAALERAIADYEALTLRFPGDIDLWLALANCHYATGHYLAVYVDNPHARMRRHVRRAKSIYERLARENPTVTSIPEGWAWCLNSPGNEPRPGATGEERQARLRDAELALALSRGLVAVDGDVPLHAALLGASLASYGAMLFDVGRRDEEALADLREGCELLERSDFTRSSFLFERGRFVQIENCLQLSICLAMSGRPGDALTAIRKTIEMDDAYTGSREVRWQVGVMARCQMLRSYLAFGAGLKEESAGSAERAANLLEPLTDSIAQETWDRAAMEGLWWMEGRRAAPGRLAEPPGRPEHAARALALLRQAADRGYIKLPATAALFGPIMGPLPEYQRLMTDLPFPADPFQPLPDTPDDGPLPPVSGAAPK
jgi:tetratricopeptide (TPR) repeat protein